jgi:transposase-like protein
MKFDDDDFAYYKHNGGQLLPFMQKVAKEFLNELLMREAQEFVQSHSDKRLPDGCQRIVLSGSYNRDLLTKVGPLNIEVPKVRDKLSEGPKIAFQNSVLPRYLRKLKEVEDLIPYLYLKGISTTEFPEVFRQLYGKDVVGISPSTVSLYIKSYVDDFKKWQERDMRDGPEYPYIYADGLYFPIRGQKENQVVLALLGINSEGTKELLNLGVGFSESSECWEELFVDLRDRGMSSPKLVVGDGALGLWKALKDVYPDCSIQTCWVHKCRNVLGHLPIKLRNMATNDLKEIYNSECRKDAELQIEKFSGKYGAKYPKAVESIKTKKDNLLTFYNFPAEHWQSLRTTNIIESIFSSVRNRTHKMRGISNINTICAVVYKHVEVAGKKLYKIRNADLLKDVCKGKRFVDGLLVKKKK